MSGLCCSHDSMARGELRTLELMNQSRLSLPHVNETWVWYRPLLNNKKGRTSPS